MAKPGYLWESHNGCARCEALAGYHEADALPARPHVRCQCDILQGGPVKEIMGRCYFADIVDLRVIQWWAKEPGSHGRLAYDYLVLCLDGREARGTVEVDVLSDDFFDFDADQDTFLKGYYTALLDAIDKLHEQASELCCPASPTS